MTHLAPGFTLLRGGVNLLEPPSYPLGVAAIALEFLLGADSMKKLQTTHSPV